MVRICLEDRLAEVVLRQGDFQVPERKILTSGCTGGQTFGRYLAEIERFRVPDGPRLRPDSVYVLMRKLYDSAGLYRRARGVHTSILADGEELLDYLHRRDQFANPADSPRPGLILLDLNMPRKDGREALREIKADPTLRSIPIVVLTTSKQEEDILRTYDLGVNSFITKPVTFEGLVDVIKTLGRYWFQLVALPPERQAVRDG